MENRFEIATETGGRFCDCDNSGALPVLYGKEGPLTLDHLLMQVRDSNLAKQMRSKNGGKQRDPTRNKKR